MIRTLEIEINLKNSEVVETYNGWEIRKIEDNFFAYSGEVEIFDQSRKMYYQILTDQSMEKDIASVRETIDYYEATEVGRKYVVGENSSKTK